MKTIENGRVLRDNKLFFTVRDPAARKNYTQGKRVGKDCPLTGEERRAIVKQGVPRGVAFVREKRNISLAEAWNLVRSAMGSDLLR